MVLNLYSIHIQIDLVKHSFSALFLYCATALYVVAINLLVSQSDQGAMVSIMHSSSITYVMFYFGHELTLGVDTLAFHRKASAADKAMFDCLIPNFKTKEAYILTWANATSKDGFVVSGLECFVMTISENVAFLVYLRPFV